MPEPEDESHSEGPESDGAELNRDLFKDQHGSVKFFIHESIKKKFPRRNLTRNIQRHGGIVQNSHFGCDTVLVDVLYNKKEELQTTYNSDNHSDLRKVFVEYTSFIQHCIQSNRFVHRIPALKGMGGTVGGRVPFTERDDECLCCYLARILPDKAAGGRLGLAVYKRLVDMAPVRDSHAWGARHTAESWKERYKKNAINFDRWIEDIVKLEGRSRKQLWHQDRRAGYKVLRREHKHEPEEEPSEEESSEGDYYKEEPLQPSRKRRRSDYSSSPPSPNRRRVLQRDEKGKARAVEEEEEEEGESDEPDLYEGLFSMDELGDEPGPSGSRHTLEATTVAADDLTHRTQLNTASFFTQETIVASDPSGSSKRASHLPDDAAESSSFVRPSTQVTRGAKQASPSGHEPLTVVDLTPPSRSTGRSSPVIQQSPTRTLVNPPQTQAAQPSTYKRPLKAARRPRAMIEAAIPDAPYKNTRSRSQSVEPPVRLSKEKGTKGKQRAMPELATVDEVLGDKVGEIAANEIEVEKMLIEDEDEVPDDLNQVRGVSLDTDDAQTEQNLRPTQPPRQVIPSLGRHPSDILKEFQEHSVLTSPLTRRSHLSNNRPAFRVRNTQENVLGIPPPSLSRNVSVPYKVAEPPRTPRRNSTSSTKPFPVSGTKASALKKTLQQQEKRTPYKPPSRTRAAQFARSKN